VPYKVSWIDHIGLAFFFFNLCLFVMNIILISMRFYLRPGSFTNSFTDQMESLFISSCVCASLLPLNRDAKLTYYKIVSYVSMPRYPASTELS
jgi:tellurite resistance protein TehA-like permease